MRTLRVIAAQFGLDRRSKNLKFIFGGGIIALFLIFGMSQSAYADVLIVAEQIVVSPAQLAVNTAISAATTEVGQAVTASTSATTAIQTASTEYSQASTAVSEVTEAKIVAQTASTEVQTAITSINQIIVSETNPVDQSFSIIQDAKTTVTTSSSAITNLNTQISEAQTEITQASTTRTTAATAVTTAQTELTQANTALDAAQNAVNNLQSTIATTTNVLSGLDDSGIRMNLPFSMLMGGVLYNNVYVGTNATVTFGVDEGWVYYTTPNAPSVSIAGYDWTTWSQGSGITYSTTGTSLDIAWDLRVYPLMDMSTQMSQIRFNADVNPTSGAWVANVSATGPIPNGSRFNVRQTTGGALTAIVDTNPGPAFNGQIGQGTYVAPLVDPNAGNAEVQVAIDSANATIAQLNSTISTVVATNASNQSALNAIPSVTSLTNTVNSAVTTSSTLSATLVTKSQELISAIDQRIPTPAPILGEPIIDGSRVTIPVSLPEGFTPNTWFYQVITEDETKNPYGNTATTNTDGAPTSISLLGLEPGVTYTIRVANWSGPVSQYTDVVVSLRGTNPPPPHGDPRPVFDGPATDVTPDQPSDEAETPPAEEPPVEEPPAEEPPTEEPPADQPPVDEPVTDEPSQEPSEPPAPGPEPSPEPSPDSPSDSPVPGLEPNSPDSLPEDTPKEAPEELLVAHEQVDQEGVENGGIEFFGTKTQPQVIGEDGKLTPAPPPPGSGLPIPPDAITVTETFIGQPGGVTFNAPDVAVPVAPTYVCKTIVDESGSESHIDINGNMHSIEQCTFLPAALDSIPGAAETIQALGLAFNAMQNIGNDMSPITRKKAKKILVATLVVGQIVSLRRRFGA